MKNAKSILMPHFKPYAKAVNHHFARRSDLSNRKACKKWIDGLRKFYAESGFLNY